MLTFKDLGHYGRLGNQLFQVASTIGIAMENNDIAVFPRWFCNYTKKEITRFFKNPVSETLNPATKMRTYDEPAFNYTPVKYTGTVNLHGYFQSERYFKHCEELIRYYFEPNYATVMDLDQKYGDILQSNTCSIHVRRGDYVNNKMHDVTDMGYYDRAISHLKSITNIDKFLIFSDDIQWCRTNFEGPEFTFIDGNLDIEDLFIMSMCKHNVMTNSSFSWWGSWLNKNESKIVIAPERWFGPTGPDCKDIYTEKMTKI